MVLGAVHHPYTACGCSDLLRVDVCRHPVVRGTGKPAEQPCDPGDSRRWRDPDDFPYREPFVCELRGTLSQPCPCGSGYGGFSLLPSLGHRLRESRPCAREDSPGRKLQPGRWKYHHPAAGEDTLSAPGCKQQDSGSVDSQDGVDQAQGVGHCSQARAQLHQGRDHEHVYESDLLRKQCVRHKGRSPDILRKISDRPDRGRGGDACGHGQQAYKIQSGAQS